MKKIDKLYVFPAVDFTLTLGNKSKLFKASNDDVIDEFVEAVNVLENSLILGDGDRSLPMEYRPLLVQEDILYGMNIGAVGCGVSEYLINLTSEPLINSVEGNIGTAKFEFKPMLEKDVILLPDILDILGGYNLLEENIYLLIEDDYEIKDPVLLNSDCVYAIKVSSIFNN